MKKMVYLIASKSYDNVNKEMRLDYIADKPEHRKNVFEYWYTYNINDAKRFYSKEEVFKYLLDNPQQYGGAILLEYAEEYLDNIRDNEKVKKYIGSLNGF